MLKFFPEKLPSVSDTSSCIVVGSGIAGLTLALELSKENSVILMTKSTLDQSNTAHAQGGIACVLERHDSPELHYQDTLMAGAGLCNSDAVLTLVYDGPERVRNLIRMGVPFDRNEDNSISMTREAAHSRSRILHADGDATGREIAKTLVNKVQNNDRIKVLENHSVISLITRNNECCGVLALFNGELKLFLSSAVALCTGGIGQIYSSTTNPAIATGDGMALAYNAGAILQDMEFLQFHPTALSLSGAPSFLISETVRGEGAILLNKDGKRFMPDYHKLAELAPRDVVARAIFSEIQNGFGPVSLDLSKIPPETVKTRFPNIYETCLRYGLDISINPIPIAPAAHYMMGGIATDLWGRTNIPGLFAAGEAACTGVHGANRLASNSLLEGLVFGGRIAEYIDTHSPEFSDDTSNLCVHYPKLYTEYSCMNEAKKELHRLTDSYLGIVRNQNGFDKAKQLLNSVPGNQFGFELDSTYFELQHMYLLASLMLRSAEARTESRGGHFRDDYPTPTDDWRKHITICKDILEVHS